MKTLNDYMAMSYRMKVVEDEDEGGFVISYPDLPGCITCGATMGGAIANAQDAKKAWIEAALDGGVEIYEPDVEGSDICIVEYKGYVGSIEFSEEDQLYYGKVLDSRSLISYEGKSVSELIQDFHDVINSGLLK